MRHSFSLMTAIALCLSAQICWAECSGPAVDKNGDGSIDYCEAFCLSTRECCAAVGGDPDTCCQMPGQKWVDGECQERTPADYECCDIWSEKLRLFPDPRIRQILITLGGWKGRFS